MSSTKTTGGTVDSTTRPGRGKALFFIFWKSPTTLVFVRNTKRRPENPVVFLEKTTSPVHYSQGQKSSKFLWWTASWGVHRGLGVWSSSKNKKPFWEFLKNWNVFDYQRGPSWFEYSSAALETYRIFSHAGFRQKCKMASKKSSQKQLLQFTAPKAKNRQNFGGGWPPGMFIED